MTLDLIAQLESASEGSRALRDEVAVALGWETQKIGRHLFWALSGSNRCIVPPDYSRSIDAAVSAIPKGWSGQIVFEPKHGYARVSVWQPGEHEDDDAGDSFDGKAATAPLAICAAALRARMGETR